MKKIIFMLFLVGCTEPDMTRETLHKAGFYDVEITGYSAFACSEDDTFATGFKAKNSNGNIVEGTVCCGLLKSCTIRY